MPDRYLTDEDREALYDALCTNPMHGLGRGHDRRGACIVERDVTALVERIVRSHRATALREAVDEMRRTMADFPQAGRGTRAVWALNWLRGRADQIEGDSDVRL